MKIPIEWLEQYTKINKPAKEIGNSFTIIGLLLDKPPAKYENNKYSTEVLDLEHRMDRSDWLSITGCARDLAAIEKTKFSLPEVYTKKGITPSAQQLVKIEIKCPDLVNRFNTRVFRNIKVAESPDWLKNRLEAYGIPSINNIVDITNYVMVEYGQPMHAQDLAKMQKQEIVIRRAKTGETITTLHGDEVKLTPEQFVLTQNDKPTVLGGIVGGKATSVDTTTKDIILDAGNYNQVNIRKSSRILKIQNETVLRYDKFLHPELAQKAIERAVFLILELAGGDYYENVDWYPNVFPLKTFSLRLSRLEKLSGMNFNLNTVTEILNSLGYKIIESLDSGIKIEVPYFRTDIEVEDDIISDILRISDYNNILNLLISSAPPQDITPKIYRFEDKLRDCMVAIGAHEHITDPLVIRDEKNINQIKLTNALSSDKSALRSEIKETLLKAVETYKKHGETEISLFEIGKVYVKKDNQNKYESFIENRVIEFIYENTGSTFHETADKTKGVLTALLHNLGVKNYYLEKTETGANIMVGTKKIGVLYISGFSIDTVELMESSSLNSRVVSDIKNYVIENLSFIIDLEQPFGPILNDIKVYNDDIVDASVIGEYVGAEIGKNKKNILVKISYRTTETAEIRNYLIKLLTQKYTIEIKSK